MATERRWRALPDDLPTVRLLCWLIANELVSEYRTCEFGDLHHVALLSDEGYAALIRDVRPVAPTEVGR